MFDKDIFLNVCPNNFNKTQEIISNGTVETNTSTILNISAEFPVNAIIPQENTEIEASWFLILNSLFIIFLAPLFSKWWESKFNPSAAVKFGIGMILLGVGFGALAYGSSGIEQGAKTASVSLIWLVLAYLLHTMGELCVSPVGLSYVSKLVPAKKIGMMFGIWYLVNFLGNLIAGLVGSSIDTIVAKYSMSNFDT